MASALAPAPAFARTAYDGQWSVLIVTNSGPCDRANNGAVKVRVWAGQQGASGTGRLSRTDGSGTWRGTGSMGTCSGVWSAERRG